MTNQKTKFNFKMFKNIYSVGKISKGNLSRQFYVKYFVRKFAISTQFAEFTRHAARKGDCKKSSKFFERHWTVTCNLEKETIENPTISGH